MLVTFIKNLIIINKTIFDGSSSLILPALLGISTALNPNETIRISGNESSWLCECSHCTCWSYYFHFNVNFLFAASLTYVGHPFGGFLSGFLSDGIGRRRAIILVMCPAAVIFVTLGLANSFWLVCLAFFLLSFIFGLKDAPATIYISEVRYV